MKLLKQVAPAVLGLVMATSAQAALMVDSIDFIMVETDYNSRTIDAGADPMDAYMEAFNDGFLPASSDAGSMICEQQLEAFDGQTSRACGGGKRDIGTLFGIHGSATGPVEVQLGLDWGRGGFTSLLTAGSSPDVVRYNTDIWWGGNWSNGDVINLMIPTTTDFMLIGLGFEGCCDGNNTARWRSAAVDGRAAGEWQTMAVNTAVPAPPVVALFGLGLLGMLGARRRNNA
jgi:hypothetical protein